MKNKKHAHRGCIQGHKRQFPISDAALADAIATANRNTGLLMHELCDPDFDEATITKLSIEFDIWYDLEQKLVNEIIRRLDRQGQVTDAHNATNSNGWHDIISPFMERNGYQNKAGWWIKAQDK